jgi:glycosyltransferase involved in cell wall biosynthesis
MSSVSVVIPAYNAGKCIGAAIESVLAQTIPADEIIVVNDGSSDDTCAIVNSYGPRVRLISQENQGPSSARNAGVQAASSEFIAFLDADDQWLPQKTAVQLQAIRSTPGAVLCYTSLLLHYSDSNDSGMDHPDGLPTIQLAAATAELPDRLRLGNPGILPSCVMLSRAAFLQAGGFPPHLTIGEDWSLWLRLIALGPFCVVDEPLTRYRVSDTGLSANADLMLADALSMIEGQLLAGFSGIPRWLWRKRILSYQFYKAALTARSVGQRHKELRMLLQSFATWPSPTWEPRRFKVLAVTLVRALHQPLASKPQTHTQPHPPSSGYVLTDAGE